VFEIGVRGDIPCRSEDAALEHVPDASRAAERHRKVSIAAVCAVRGFFLVP